MQEFSYCFHSKKLELYLNISRINFLSDFLLILDRVGPHAV